MSTSLDTFNDQYAFAKQALESAAESGQNIVIWGSGGNGKTYLVNECRDLLVQYGYTTLPLEPGWTTSWWKNYVEAQDANPWITCIADKNQMFTTLSEDSFVLINMNKFQYPSISSSWTNGLTLRSGRRL